MAEATQHVCNEYNGESCGLRWSGGSFSDCPGCVAKAAALAVSEQSVEIASLKAQLAAKDAELSEANARIDRDASMILNIADTLRSRGFTGRKQLDERVIAMAQALDAATAQLAAKDEMLQSIGVACGFPVVLNVEQLTETIKKHIARIHRELAAKDEEIAAAFAAALDAHITDDGVII